MIEYLVVRCPSTGVPGIADGKTLQDGLNDLGKSGWQLCGIVGGIELIFCRPVIVRKTTVLRASKAAIKKAGYKL